MASTLTPEEETALVGYYARGPQAFMEDVLGSSLYAKQREALELMRIGRRIAVVGANGTGKDWLTGRAVLWWQMTRYPAKTVILGPTARQVHDIVWRECRSAFYRAPPGNLDGRMLPVASRWQLDDNHFAVGFATSDEFNLQGYHSPSLMVVITEAHNFPQDQYEAVYRLNPTKLILTGNPLCSAGEFYEAFYAQADRWATLQISGYDSPNITGEMDIPGLTTQQDIDDDLARLGEDSALFIASRLGQFPDNLEDGIVPRSKIMEAVTRTLEPDDGDKTTLGCDIGRSAADPSVVYARRGHQCRKLWEAHIADTQQVAGIIGRLAEVDESVDTVVIDLVGVGAGVYDRLRESPPAPQRVRVVGFNGGERAREQKRYVNAVTEAWLELAQAFQDDMIDIDNDAALIAQLSSRKKLIQGDRRMRLEPKEDYKKRVHRSPDHADALAMCYSPDAITRGRQPQVHNLLQQRRRPEDNPLGLDLSNPKYQDKDRSKSW